MATTYELIASVTLGSSAASITLGSGGTIPQTYDDLLIHYSLRSDRPSATTDAIFMRFNGSTSNQSFRSLDGSGSAASSTTGTVLRVGYSSEANDTANTFSSGEIYIPNYSGSTAKSYSATGAQESNTTNVYMAAVAGLWNDTSAITSISFLPEVGPNYVAGSSVYLYGITKA